MIPDEDPLHEIVRALYDGDGVAMAWVVKHSAGGDDPIRVAWKTSLRRDLMLELVYASMPEIDGPYGATRPEWYCGRHSVHGNSNPDECGACRDALRSHLTPAITIPEFARRLRSMHERSTTTSWVVRYPHCTI